MRLVSRNVLWAFIEYGSYLRISEDRMHDSFSVGSNVQNECVSSGTPLEGCKDTVFKRSEASIHSPESVERASTVRTGHQVRCTHGFVGRHAKSVRLASFF